MDVSAPVLAASPRSAARGFLRLLLALCVAVSTSWLLWESTLPGGPVVSLTMLSLPLLFAGLLWAILFARFVVRRLKKRQTGSGVWLVGAPVGAVVVLALAWSDVPLRARFSFGRGSFDEVAATIAPGKSTEDFVAVPWQERRVGSYMITSVHRIDAGIILYERHGCFLNDAGFAYLPRGPDGIQGNASWESPQFRHLEGAWYAWTASW